MGLCGVFYAKGQSWGFSRLSNSPSRWKICEKDKTAQVLLGEVNIQFRIIWYAWVYNLVCDLTSNSQLIEITIFRDSCTHI